MIMIMIIPLTELHILGLDYMIYILLFINYLLIEGTTVQNTT